MLLVAVVMVQLSVPVLMVVLTVVVILVVAFVELVILLCVSAVGVTVHTFGVRASWCLLPRGPIPCW